MLYTDCCGALHEAVRDGQTEPRAQTAEQLMRSRYAAYVVQDMAYVRHTWHVSSCPEDLSDESEQGDASTTQTTTTQSTTAQSTTAQTTTRWMGLSVLKSWPGTDENEAYVEFVAKYKVGGQGVERLHEISRFVREARRWYYVDGVFPRQ